MASQQRWRQRRNCCSHITPKLIMPLPVQQLTQFFLVFGADRPAKALPVAFHSPHHVQYNGLAMCTCSPESQFYSGLHQNSWASTGQGRGFCLSALFW